MSKQRAINLMPTSTYNDDWFASLPRRDRHIYYRGWDAYYDRDENGQWVSRWMDTNEDTDLHPRPCHHCGLANIEDGDHSYDACLGKLPGVENACCGHGATQGYIVFSNRVIVRFERIKETQKWSKRNREGMSRQLSSIPSR